MPQVYTDNAAIEFGVNDDEGTLITHKVSVSRKVKKKDLRGKQGGYKSIASYGPTVEASIDGAYPGSGTISLVLGAAHSMVNDPFSLSCTLYVESVTITEKNEDFKRASIKLTGSEDL